MSAGMHRRRLLQGAVSLGATFALGGCDRLPSDQRFRQALKLGEDANFFVQRLLLQPATLAPEFPAAEISPFFKPNGSTNPDTKAYKAMVADKFNEYRLELNGLVEQSAQYSLEDLRELPKREQITRHDCVEGWSCIGKWTGVPLAPLLRTARLKPAARYIVFHCADVMEEGGEGTNPVSYYESIDLVDAFHPQTILAYSMNDQPLPIEHGAPLRLRLERQLGYKSAKYVMRVEVVSSLESFGDGQGGYWEDRGYDWYAGI